MGLETEHDKKVNFLGARVRDYPIGVPTRYFASPGGARSEFVRQCIAHLGVVV